MKRSLYRDRLREIRKSPNRFLSIFLIVAIGTAFFAGVKAAAPNMKHTADRYYDAYNMMDIRVLSSMGLTADDIQALAEVEGVERVQPSYFADVVTTLDATEVVFRVHALPDEALAAGSEDYINRPRLVSGRFPEKSGECIIESSNAIDLGLKEGDLLTVGSGKKEGLTGVLKTTEFTVVGTAVTPCYLTYEKDTTDIGSGRVGFFMMVRASDFDYPVYVEALVTVTGARALDSYSSAYQRLVDRTQNQLENRVAERSEIRLAELQAEAGRQLEASRQELAANEAEFAREIADAQIRLEAAQDKLVSGEATLVSERKSAETRLADAQRQISQGEADLRAGEAEYRSAVAQYNQAKTAYGDSLTNLDAATRALNGLAASAQSEIDTIQNQLATDPTLTEEQRAALQTRLQKALENRTMAQNALKNLNDLNNGASTSLQQAKTSLDTAKAKLDAAEAKLAQSRRQLEAARNESEIRFASAQQEIESGTAEYTAAKAEFDTRKAEGEEKLKAAREQVIRAENQIERLEKPSLYVLDRSKLYSYADYAATADRMDAIARLFPIFFFAVAALVCLTTMTRMIDEQRGVIGTLKALGYQDGEIALKYVSYAAAASLAGGVLGAAAGVRVFPQVIFDSWSMMYTLPPMEAVPHTLLMAATVAAAVVLTTAAAYAACRRELVTTPALLMRPKAPKAGKTILLERIGPLWRRFSFSQKVTARNIFRYKKRFFMTVVGIAGCAALLVAGFGMSDSIGQIVDRQYRQIFTHHLGLRLDGAATAEEAAAVARVLDEHPEVESVLPAAEFNATVRSAGDEIAVTLVCPEDSTAFGRFVALRERRSQTSLALPASGIVVTEKLARELGAGVGDAITLHSGGAVKKVSIAAITENYIFHYAYLSREAYSEIFRLAPDSNSLMVRLVQPSAELETKLGAQLIALEPVASVVYYSDAAGKFRDTVRSLDAIVIVIILCAGLLAFVVLYNLTNINIGERIREIATIKVLGFRNREAAAYVYRENVVLSLIGAVCGLGAGVFLHRAIMASIEQPGIMFGSYIAGQSFGNAFAITIAFTLLVSILTYRRLKRIPMVESLKAVE